MKNDDITDDAKTDDDDILDFEFQVIEDDDEDVIELTNIVEEGIAAKEDESEDDLGRLLDEELIDENLDLGEPAETGPEESTVSDAEGMDEFDSDLEEALGDMKSLDEFEPAGSEGQSGESSEAVPVQEEETVVGEFETLEPDVSGTPEIPQEDYSQAVELLDDEIPEQEPFDQDLAGAASINEEKLEEIVKRVMEEVLEKTVKESISEVSERVIRQTVSEVAERVIGEAIHSLKESMDSSSDQ